MSKTDAHLEPQYPSVDLAYGLVLPSYQLLVGRFEAADNRLHTLLTLVVTVTTAVPLFARNVAPAASFNAPSFKCGLIVAAAAAVVCVLGRVIGTITIVNPNVIYKENLHKTPWVFKKDAIYRAGQHFSNNLNSIKLKGWFTLSGTVLLFLEVAAFAVWLSK
jgi:hypothetical protein